MVQILPDGVHHIILPKKLLFCEAPYCKSHNPNLLSVSHDTVFTYMAIVKNDSEKKNDTSSAVFYS